MRVCFLILCFYSIVGYSQELQTRIAIEVHDQDTNSPISDFKIEVVAVYTGNGTTYISNNSLLGYTNQCGYVEQSVSQSKASVGSHGVYSNKSFWAAFYTLRIWTIHQIL